MGCPTISEGDSAANLSVLIKKLILVSFFGDSITITAIVTSEISAWNNP